MWASSRIADLPGGGAPLRAAAVLLAGALGSCAVGPNYVRPAPPPVSHYVPGADPVVTVEAQGVAQRFAPGTALAPDWWHLFNSTTLDAIVAEALRRNPSLEAAEASLRASEENLHSGYGIFFPQVEADASATRQRFAPIKYGQGSSGSVFNLFTLSASVSYALDVFGGNRRMIEGLKAQVDWQRANEQAAYLTLIANVINTVVARAAYQAEVEATRQLIDLAADQVKLAEAQALAGTVPYSNVLSLTAQLAAYQASIPPLQQKLAQCDDLLSSLVGRAPAEWKVPPLSLAELTLPGQLPVELPSELVAQRPDILMAEATAHAASANVGVATAAMLPAINLNGAYSASGLSTSSVFASSGRAWSAGADLAAPLFEGGTLWYKRKAALEDYHQASALYRQTVLGAFAQVADTLQALDHDAAMLQAEDKGLKAAADALHLAQSNYAAGLDTYLEVLLADAQYHQAQVSDLQGVALRYQDTVALYVALGGGWWNPARPRAGVTP